jgi:hypothetical protein
MNIYNSNFRVEYKNIKGADSYKYAYNISDLRNVMADYGCPLSTPDLDYIRDMEKDDIYTITFPKGYATINIIKL